MRVPRLQVKFPKVLSSKQIFRVKSPKSFKFKGPSEGSEGSK